MFVICSDRRKKASNVKVVKKRHKKCDKSPNRIMCCTRLMVPCSLCVTPVSLVPSHQYALADAFPKYSGRRSPSKALCDWNSRRDRADVERSSAPSIRAGVAGLKKPLSLVPIKLRGLRWNAEAQVFDVGETAMYKIAIASKSSEIVEHENEKRLDLRA
jgi:hypothetical protein